MTLNATRSSRSALARAHNERIRRSSCLPLPWPVRSRMTMGAGGVQRLQLVEPARVLRDLLPIIVHALFASHPAQHGERPQRNLADSRA